MLDNERMGVYLLGIDSAEVINAIHNRRPPMMPATAGLKL